jgi:hypothetical protein
MGLFKSKEERRIERDMEVRKGISAMKRNIRTLEKNEKGYVKKAMRAKQIGAMDQLDFIKKTLKKTACQRRMLERQLLNIETAAQIKNQAEAHAQFARSMHAVSRSIAEVFGTTNWAETQKDFEKAMAQAESIEQRMEIFLDMSADSMFGYEGAASEDLVSDDEIDRLIETEIAHEEGKTLDKEIDAGLTDLEKELGRE